MRNKKKVSAVAGHRLIGIFNAVELDIPINHFERLIHAQVLIVNPISVANCSLFQMINDDLVYIIADLLSITGVHADGAVCAQSSHIQ